MQQTSTLEMIQPGAHHDDVALNGQLTARIVRGSSEIPAEDWDRLCQEADAGIGMDRRFLAATEACLKASSEFWHVVIYDAAGSAVACTSFSTCGLDLSSMTEGTMQRLGRSVRSILPGFLHSKVLFCGLPVFFGQSHISFAPGSSRGKVTELLEATARRIARKERAKFIVFKEFDQTSRASLYALEDDGYLRLDTPPMYHFTPRTHSFETYCASLKGKYRHEIRRILKKFDEAGLKHERTTDPRRIAELYTPAVHRLYESVAERSEFNVGAMPASFIPLLAEKMPGHVSLGIITKGDDVVRGFSVLLHYGRKCHFLFCGFDKELGREGEVYFNIMYRDLAYGMSLEDVEDIEVGQTAEFLKTRLGCQPEPLALYMRAVNPAFAVVLKVGQSKILKSNHPSPTSNHIYRDEG